MEIFEIHITGDSKINEVATRLGVKNIVIDLVKPDFSYHRTEHMTSDVKKFDDYQTCKQYVDNLVHKLVEEGVNVVRVKIESPYYPHYKTMSCYMESHFNSKDNKHPLSRNQNKTSYLATDRTYNKAEYETFREKYKEVDVELCLYDSDLLEDADWFALYPRMS
jgi:hypothetical protein